MRIYLDWGVINKMRCASEADDVFFKMREYLLKNKDYHVIPCTGAHLTDLASSDSDEHRDEVEKDLDFLEELTRAFTFAFDQAKNVEQWENYQLKTWYEDVVDSNRKFFKDGNYLENFAKDLPFDGLLSGVMNSLKLMPSGITSEQLDTLRDQDFTKMTGFFQRSADGSFHDLLGETMNMMQSFNNDDKAYKGVRNEFREKYKLHGSYDDQNVIQDMEAKLKKLSEDLSFETILKAMIGNKENPDRFKLFTTHYLMLDFFGYQVDGKFRNMVQDATHAFYAGFCDMYISDDAKARAKTKAVYNHLSIRTDVVSPEGFANERMEKMLGPQDDLSVVLVDAIKNGLIETNVNDEGTPVTIHELPLMYGYFNRLQVNYEGEDEHGLFLYKRKRTLSDQTLYREIHQIVDLMQQTLGPDIHERGLYSEDDRLEIEANKWSGRAHLWGTHVLHLLVQPHLGLTMNIDTIDHVRRLAVEQQEEKNKKGSPKAPM